MECCPPNLVRFLAGMPGYIYAQDAEGVFVNLYVSSNASFTIGSRELSLSIDSGMPWGGVSRIAVSPQPVRTAIRLRLPGWARNSPAPGGLYAYADKADEPTTIAINGRQVPALPDPRGYVSLDREWRSGDVVAISFPFAIRQVVADARVRETRGRVAIERGPMVFCAEAPGVEDRHALSLQLDPSVELKPRMASGMLGGVAAIHAAVKRQMGAASYPKVHRSRSLSVVGPSRPRRDECVALDARLRPGRHRARRRPHLLCEPERRRRWMALSRSRPDRSERRRPMGLLRTAIAGARGSGIGTGRQNTSDMLAACTERGTAAICAPITS